MTPNRLPIRIEDPDDPRIQAYLNIRERDLVRNRRCFIAEGTSVLRVLVTQHRFSIESVLVLENRLPGVSDVVEQLPAHVPVHVASSAVMDAIAGFPMHRGVLAIANRRADADEPPGMDEARGWRTVVALVGLANHDNMGAIFRNAAALGADAVLMDRQSCDPLYRKAVRVSVGGVLTVPWHRFDDAETMLDWLERGGFELAGLSPRGTTALHQWRPAGRTALVLGAEGAGLPQAALARCEGVRIDMDSGFDSLNVATCAAIVLHHLRVRRNHEATRSA